MITAVIMAAFVSLLARDLARKGLLRIHFKWRPRLPKGSVHEPRLEKLLPPPATERCRCQEPANGCLMWVGHKAIPVCARCGLEFREGSPTLWQQHMAGRAAMDGTCAWCRGAWELCIGVCVNKRKKYEQPAPRSLAPPRDRRSD